MLKFPEDKTSVAFKIKKLIYKAVLSCFKESNIKITSDVIKISFDDIVLDHPEDPKHGDYSVNIAMRVFSQIRKKHLRGGKGVGSPLDLARLIAKKIPKVGYLEAVEVAGSGFLNFWLSREYFFEVLNDCLKFREKFGKSQIGRGKKVMVEFAQPNTHKPFHLGHLRNICLGEAVSRLLGALGVSVIRANYQGDVGLHIAKCLFGIKKLRKEELKTLQDLGTKCHAEFISASSKILNPFGLSSGRKQVQNDGKCVTPDLDEKIDFLGKAYVVGNKVYEEDERAQKEIIKINHQIYQKDAAVLGLWQETRQWSLDDFERIYQRLNTKFDRLYFESECLEGMKIVQRALRWGILKRSKGAVVFPGEKYDLDTRVFITAEGLPTYEAKELKLAEMEFSEHGELDQVIHVVGPEQISFFKVTFKVEELLDPKKYKDKQYHRVYGWVRLKKGKMSSRADQVVTAEWLLDEVKKRIKQVMGKVKKSKIGKNAEKIGKNAEIIAVAAVKYSMLKLNPEKELVFDIDESINLQGDSGPYLQYTYARTQSVLRKSKINPPVAEQKSKLFRFHRESPTESRYSRLVESHRTSTKSGQFKSQKFKINREEEVLLHSLYKFPEVIEKAGREYAPNLICNFLYDLTTKFNTFYSKHRILNPEEGKEVSEFRLALTAGVGQVLKTGLELLGIGVLEQM